MARRHSSWAKAIVSSSAFWFGPARNKPGYRRRLLLEPLEDRCVLTSITPTLFADGGLGSGSLRDAVLQANADAGSEDDTIQLQAGTYTLTIRNTGGHHEMAGLEGDLNITSTAHRLIIQGAGSSGANATIVDASQLQDRVFQIVNAGTQVVVQDLVIQGGLAQDDGSNGALAGTTDALGGGLLNNGGNVTLDDVVLQNNVARGGDAAVLRAPGHNARGGGIYSTGGALTIAGATIAHNQALGGRGGDHDGILYAGNGGSAGGGALSATGGSLNISDSMITGNRATGGQGGNGSGYTTFGGANGGGGGYVQGGGLYVNGGSLTIATSTIASNQGSGGPAGLYGDIGVGYGGGVYNNSRSTLTVSDSTLSGNTAPGGLGYGGGIYNSDLSTLTVSDSTLSGNSAGLLGGGVYSSGTVTVSNSTLSGNSAGIGGGGGIFNEYNGTLTVSNSTLSGNSAGGGGGISNSGTLTVSNSTLSGNSAGGIAGGISTGGTHSVTLTNVTLTANRCGSGVSIHGGGLYVPTGAPVLHNTLIAGNFKGATGTTRDDVYGALNPGGDYNLIGDATGMTGLSNGVHGNLVGSAAAPLDPLLGPLQDNGGPTFTHALLAGSPALNAGNPSQLGVADQRGVVRAGGVNIGAYQASASAFVVTAPATATAGTPFDLTVTAVDTFGQVALGYTGTVTFATTDGDPAVVVPVDYLFRADDHGKHTFSAGFTLLSPGDQTLTVTDMDDGFSASLTLTVKP
jgi:hypothetical protein